MTNRIESELNKAMAFWRRRAELQVSETAMMYAVGMTDGIKLALDKLSIMNKNI